MFAQELTSGHVDYTWFNNCGVAIDAMEKSRAHILASRIGNSTGDGVRARGCSSFFMPASNGNTFTGNANDSYFGVGSSRIDVDQNGRSKVLAYVDTLSNTTQSATPITVLTKTFLAGELASRGTGFELEIHGDVNGVANTKTITVALGATTLLTAVVAAATTDWKIKITFINRTAASSQKYTTEFYQNGVLPAIAVASSAENMAIARDLTITHQVTNVADRSDIELVALTTIK